MKVYVYPLLETLERANVHGMFLKCQMDDITTKLFSRAYLGGYIHAQDQHTASCPLTLSEYVPKRDCQSTHRWSTNKLIY